ncbi:MULTISPECIES: Zn-dependent alcohol dehydrogenase [unclassified Caballeronia]|uniref:Zn-dependent alcohol dehydrogenase n=1 Tax=unclassified Caballeronia TaxID=2646786 RepID=UPI00285BACC4|nr:MULTISPECIES: Zn-dependent alcohol dehydrogenase [unclassified Caballeronia]MDR5773853.1 Zn-dependent alcohol dehydrogenase [Caballeronia sp. LZ002]MDR5849288.1 Zn-dependent alcohol dehydrogenase [Caballeronia sp. LZ003]
MTNTKFEAAVLERKGEPLQLRRVTLGNLADTDVIVRVKATSLCHTDLEAVRGDLRTPLPFVPGHEAAGIVEWAGNAVRGVKVGDHVVTSWNPHCGACFYCARKLSILCQPYRDHAAQSFHFDGAPRLFLDDGAPVHQLMYSGSFAELCVVSEECAVKVPHEMPFDRACLIGCGVMTGVGAALNVAKVEPGSTVTVIGCGAVGLSAVQGARLAGAARIIAVDRSSDKLDLARAVGATHALSADDNLAAAHADLTQGRGADYVFEAAGNRASLRTSVELARPGAHVVWLGKLPAEEEASFRWASLMGEKQIVRSSYGGANPASDFPMLAKAYLDGSLKLDEYVTSHIALADINDGLQRLATGAELRAVIEF